MGVDLFLVIPTKVEIHFFSTLLSMSVKNNDLRE